MANFYYNITDPCEIGPVNYIGLGRVFIYSIRSECSKFNHRGKRRGGGGGGEENFLYLKGGARKKNFKRMRGHEKFTMSLEIFSSPPPGINNDCSLNYTMLNFDHNSHLCHFS